MKVYHKIITGTSLLLMALIAILAISISEHLSLRIICWTLIIFLDIIVSWGLYFIFRRVNEDLSAILRLS